MMSVARVFPSDHQLPVPAVAGLPFALRFCAVALGYAIASGCGQLVSFLPPGNVTAVFPASGVALAAVLLGGPRFAPAIWVGSMLGNFGPLVARGQPGTGLACAVVLGLCETAQAVGTVWLFRRITGAVTPFGRARDAAWFIVVAALGGCAINSAMGTLVVCAADYARWANGLETWATWWLGDASGVLVIAPLLLAWSNGGPNNPLGLRLFELGLLFVLPGVICIANIYTKCPLEYIYLPLLTWAAFRFGTHGATTLTALIAGLAVVTTIHGHGSFLSSSRNESLLLLQAFLATIGTSTLVLLGVISQRDAAERRLAITNETLEQRVAERMAELAELNLRLLQMANRDPLTDLANRRCFDDALEREWRRCGRYGMPLAIILMDLDSFKDYNDTFGHPAGDDCLRRIGQALAGGLQRSGELLARYGGEEFVALLPGTDLEQATETAERLRQIVLDCAISHPACITGPVVSLSAGVSAAVPTAEAIPALLVTAADASLYAAKHAGRNRVGRPAELLVTE
jgi:diguanylate cyclase (GGDEF)-like protein